MTPLIIDLDFHTPETIACYALPVSAHELVLIDPGPYSTYATLARKLEAMGRSVDQVVAVLLTHIHFDHAGASWAFAEKGADVFVHPLGYKHMQDPTKLVESATRIYGDQMDALWGPLKPIAAERLHEVADEAELTYGELTFKAWHTPGHAVHHIAWQLGEEIYCGDVGGCRIPGGPVQPPCPPPDIHLEDWQVSINRLRDLNPKTLYPTHFGPVSADIPTHLDDLEETLFAWGDWIKKRMEEGLSPQEMITPFTEYAMAQLRAAGCDEKTCEKYQWANPAFMSVWGLTRYWKKRAEREAASA